MRFRLSDETVWTREFDAADAAGLARGIAATWDERIEAVRREPGATHPAFALSARMAEVDTWLAKRLARQSVTAENVRSWEAQAAHWRFTARRDLGGDEASSPLRLHVWASGDPGRVSVWTIPLVRRDSAWGWPSRAPSVARVVDDDASAALWERAAATVQWMRRGDTGVDALADGVRSALHPRPTLVREPE